MDMTSTQKIIARGKRGMLRSVFRSDLLTTKLLLGVSSLMMSVAIYFFEPTKFTPHVLTSPILSTSIAALFLIHACSVCFELFMGVRNKTLCVLDGVLCSTLWAGVGIMAIMDMSASGHFDVYQIPTFSIAIAAWWVLARYPKFNEKE